MVLSLVFARTILDGLLYTIVKLFWKLIQSRIVPTLVLVDIFWFREHCQLADSRLKLHWQAKLRSIDSCQNGTCETTIRKLITRAQVRSGTRSGIFHYTPDGNVLLTLVVC